MEARSRVSREGWSLQAGLRKNLVLALKNQSQHVVQSRGEYDTNQWHGWEEGKENVNYLSFKEENHQLTALITNSFSDFQQPL